MRLLDLRSLLMLTTTLSLAGCPGDDSGDDANDSANDGSTTALATTTGDDPSTSGSDPSTSGADPSTSGADESTGELILADVEVTVMYEGMETGTLNVVALTEFPPMGPPSAIATDMEPTFPWMGSLTGLEPGEYIVFAVLDVGGNNPTMPGPEDPQGMTMMPVMVDGEGPFPVEVTLVDPE